MCIYCGNINHNLSKDSGAYSLGKNGTNQQLADYLTEGFWEDFGVSSRKFNLTNSGVYAKDGVITYNTTGNYFDADGLSTERSLLVEDAFDLIEVNTGIDFQKTTENNADFRFGDNNSGAYASSSTYQGNINYININIASNWYGGRSGFGNYTFQTIIHEIGHGLGLGHQGDYNGWANYSSHANFANDSWQSSAMSYFSQSENSSINASYSFLSTFMPVDWIALNDLYSPQGYGTSNAFKSDTTWGFNTNILSSTSEILSEMKDWIDTTSFTIVDGGGEDTFDFSGFSNDQLIDLRSTEKLSTELYASNIGGYLGNLLISEGTIIENVYAGDGSDTIVGNSADNNIDGGGGIDTFTLSKNFSDYEFVNSEGRLIVVGEGVDTLSNIENVEFNDITKSLIELLPSTTEKIIHDHVIGEKYKLEGIKDFDGYLHGSSSSVSDSVKNSYKYQGSCDVNNDNIVEAIFTNSESSRWVTAEINSRVIDFSKYGFGDSTRIVGIYTDPLVSEGIVLQGSEHDSQQRFLNDLSIDNLDLRDAGDYDSDGFQEIYWKTNDGTSYLRALMHSDGNIQYANYQSKEQMTEYLTITGNENSISTIA